MKLHLLIMTLTAALISCGTKNQENSKTKEIAIEELKLSEVVHDSLTTVQIKKIEEIHRTFAEVISSSLEETITNFKRDQHPDNEIAVWITMAKAYERFTSSKELSLDKKKEAFDIILLRSMMTEAEVLERIKSSDLTSDEVKEIFSYYADAPEPLKVMGN
ncbi:MAG TPA: hypothetical protein VIU12_29200 [Chryseolinea sp.]